MNLEEVEFESGTRMIDITGLQMWRASRHDGSLSKTNLIPVDRTHRAKTYNYNNGVVTAINDEGGTFVGFGMETRPLEKMGYKLDSGIPVECLEGACPDPTSGAFRKFDEEYKKITGGKSYTETWGPATTAAGKERS